LSREKLHRILEHEQLLPDEDYDWNGGVVAGAGTQPELSHANFLLLPNWTESSTNAFHKTCTIHGNVPHKKVRYTLHANPLPAKQNTNSARSNSEHVCPSSLTIFWPAKVKPPACPEKNADSISIDVMVT
jgi:hypothetical protein